MTAEITRLIDGRPRDVGGFAVRRVLPAPRQRTVGPFIFLDEMGPAAFAPGQGIDVRAHPHIGLATVTYLFEGRIVHRDSLGVEQAITPGAVNLMTAGRGITHSERTHPDDRSSGHRLHGIQTWLALPRALEETEPGFVHHPADSLPRLEVDGASVRLIAGAAFGAVSPVAMASPTFYADATVPAGVRLPLPVEVEERGVYVVSGVIELAGETLTPGRLAVLGDGPAELRASADSRAMLIGGAATDGPRQIWWNLVASDPARIERAKADWRASAGARWRDGRFTLPDGEQEYFPLPES